MNNERKTEEKFSMIKLNSPTRNPPFVNGLISSNNSPISNRSSHHQISNQNRIQWKTIFYKIFFTFLFTLLFIFIIEFLRLLVQENSNQINEHLTIYFNQTNKQKTILMKSFFAYVWLYNFVLFVFCFILHVYLYKKEENLTKIDILRQFGRIFSTEQITLTNYLFKTCLLCLLWYLTCYLMLYSISILFSLQIIILYSITITFREVLGWIFLHELFIGNKIIGYILSLSSFLFLLHNDGFHLNKYLFTLILFTISVSIKTTFDILIINFVKDLTSRKMRIVMINVCLCGTCLLWPFILILHLTKIEFVHPYSSHRNLFLLTFSLAILFHLLNISIPNEYTNFSKKISLLLAIPSIAFVDYYLFEMKYSSLIFCSIVCSCLGILFSIVPKDFVEQTDRTKLKQLFKCNFKQTNSNEFNNSIFEQIRAQRRIRNALLSNEMKT